MKSSKSKKKERKVFMVPGDEIEFTLSPGATFEKGNVFTGRVDSIHHEKFSVHVVPSAEARKRLKAMLKNGVFEAGFRCCRIKDLDHHSRLLVSNGIEALQKKFTATKQTKPIRRKKEITVVYNPEAARAEARAAIEKKTKEA